MIRIAARLSVCVVACGLFAQARGDDRPAKTIVDEIKAIKRVGTKQQAEKKVGLIGELRKADPENDQLPRLLPERWSLLAALGKGDEALAEMEEVLPKATNATLKKEGAFAKIMVLMRADKVDKAADAAEEFAKSFPTDNRAASLLYQVSQGMEDDNPKKVAIENKLLEDFSNTQTAEAIKADRKIREAIGKPFELEFDEAIKGTHMSMKDLKGKVVVIDFWATWCGPCVGEMPNMKKLYEEYKGKGVEFIGVSLDQPKEQGGLDALKKFVEKNEIAWPQYYQGKGWKSEFSMKWGINGIPCVFVVDADGNLYSMKARGQLEKMIPELLKKAKPAAAAAGR